MLSWRELREMDGEPVWVELRGLVDRSFWAIIHIDPETGALFAEDGRYTLYSHLYGRRWIAYRRKPEEGSVWQQQ